MWKIVWPKKRWIFHEIICANKCWIWQMNFEQVNKWTRKIHANLSWLTSVSKMRSYLVWQIFIEYCMSNWQEVPFSECRTACVHLINGRITSIALVLVKDSEVHAFLSFYSSYSKLPVINGQTVTLTLPGNYNVQNINWLAIWSRTQNTNLGYVMIPSGLNVPPTLAGVSAGTSNSQPPSVCTSRNIILSVQ